MCSNCFECYIDIVGFLFGLDMWQLNGFFKYFLGVMVNQIVIFEYIGFFDVLVVCMLVFVDYCFMSVIVEDWVWLYLYFNCVICYWLDGVYLVIDLWVGVMFVSMRICNFDFNKGDIGVMGVKCFIFGVLDRLLMVLCMQVFDKVSGCMLQFVILVFDILGISLVLQWVQGIMSCLQLC